MSTHRTSFTESASEIMTRLDADLAVSVAQYVSEQRSARLHAQIEATTAELELAALHARALQARAGTTAARTGSMLGRMVAPSRGDPPQPPPDHGWSAAASNPAAGAADGKKGGFF